MNVQLPDTETIWNIIWGVGVFIAGGALLAGKNFFKAFLSGEQSDKHIVLERGTIANMGPVREIVDKLDKLNSTVERLVSLIADTIDDRKDELEIQRRVDLGVEKELKKGDAAYRRATRPERERP